MATFSDIPTDSYNEVATDIAVVPKPITVDTFDLHNMFRRGESVPCSQCAKHCLNSHSMIENRNPCHPQGSNVTNAIPFCGPKCKSTFIEECRETTPFPVDKDVVFGFDLGSGGPEDGWWTMFSIIPEGGKWVICQCTDEGELLLDEKNRPIWMLVSNTALRGASRVYN